MGKKKQNKKPRSMDGVVYSTIDKGIINIAKKVRERAGDQFLNFSSEFWLEMAGRAKKQYPQMTPAMVFADQVMIATIAYRKYQTIFIESEDVLDFLKSTKTRQTDCQLVMQAFSDLSSLCDGNGIVIHMPKTKHSITVQPMGRELIKGAIFDTEVDICIFYQDFDHTGYFAFGEKSFRVDYMETDPVMSFIINLFVYMSAFPLCVQDGTPSLSMPYTGESKTITVSAAQPIREEYAQSKITPHMRRGHFRVLRSEVFKNKRFQAVYVKPSMVCGKALTVSGAA
jgi:hypothetical protein